MVLVFDKPRVLAGHLALVMHFRHAGQERETLLCDERAAPRFLTKALRRHGIPETMTIDGSEANAAPSGGTMRHTARRSSSVRCHLCKMS